MFYWGDALGLAYVGVVCPDSSFRGTNNQRDRVPSAGPYPRGSAPVGTTLTPRIADRLHIDQDAVRVRVVAEVVDQVAPADVEHRAGGHARGEADVFREAPVEDRREQRAALAQERDVARPRHPAGKLTVVGMPATPTMTFGLGADSPLAQSASAD